MNAVTRRATSIEVITPPTAEPIDLATARLHLRLDAEGTPPAHPDDALVSLWIAAAREECERYTNRRLMTQTVVIGQLGPGDATMLELPLAPVQSIASLETVDAAGALAPVSAADYVPLLGVVPPRLVPAQGAAWPASTGVKTTAVVGYPSAGEVPPAIKAAILLLLGQVYELRESGVEATWGEAMPVPVARLLAPFRLWLF